MDNLFLKKIPVYFETEKVQLIPGDAMKILAKMKPESVDLIFADGFRKQRRMGQALRRSNEHRRKA